MLRNRRAIGAVVGVVALQLIAVYVGPIAEELGVRPPGGREWAIVIALSLVPAIVGQAVKLFGARVEAWKRAAFGQSATERRPGNPDTSQ